MRKLRQTLGWLGLLTVVLTLLHCGVVHRRFEVSDRSALPFDALIIPGCPSDSDGRLSACQQRRAVWAAISWERGVARNFITSGGAVHSPFVEAEAIAAAMAALGVPADRIYLEPNALHTDENVYNAWQIAQRRGWQRLAVASDRGQAAFACQLLASWQAQCGAFSMDYQAVQARRQAAAAALATVRTAASSDWIPLATRERQRAAQSGQQRRLPSFLLYPGLLLRSVLGRPPWRPLAPPSPPLLTWADRLSATSALKR
jgi:hypothetical protein